jgi:hypothetical protein
MPDSPSVSCCLTSQNDVIQQTQNGFSARKQSVTADLWIFIETEVQDFAY